MQESRHPHPHIDPRQPRDGTQPGTNPPVLVWKPPQPGGNSRLVVARDSALRDRVLDLELAESAYLPESAFPPGRYYWQWSNGDAAGEMFSFEITPEATVLEVPAAAEWLRRFGSRHPRIWIRAEQVEELRASRIGVRAQLWPQLQASADRLLDEPHNLAEPPFLPDWEQSYQEAFDVSVPHPERIAALRLRCAHAGPCLSGERRRALWTGCLSATAFCVAVGPSRIDTHRP